MLFVFAAIVSIFVTSVFAYSIVQVYKVEKAHQERLDSVLRKYRSELEHKKQQRLQKEKYNATVRM